MRGVLLACLLLAGSAPGRCTTVVAAAAAEEREKQEEVVGPSVFERKLNSRLAHTELLQIQLQEQHELWKREGGPPSGSASGAAATPKLALTAEERADLAFLVQLTLEMEMKRGSDGSDIERMQHDELMCLQELALVADRAFTSTVAAEKPAFDSTSTSSATSAPSPTASISTAAAAGEQLLAKSGDDGLATLLHDAELGLPGKRAQQLLDVLTDRCLSWLARGKGGKVCNKRGISLAWQEAAARRLANALVRSCLEGNAITQMTALGHYAFAEEALDLLGSDTGKDVGFTVIVLFACLGAFVLLDRYVFDRFLFREDDSVPCFCQFCDQKLIADQIIGEGGFGQVLVCHDPSAPEGTLVVTKFIQVDWHKDLSVLQDALDEAKVLLELRHENIVEYEDVFMHREGTQHPQRLRVHRPAPNTQTRANIDALAARVRQRRERTTRRLHFFHDYATYNRDFSDGYISSANPAARFAAEASSSASKAATTADGALHAPGAGSRGAGAGAGAGGGAVCTGRMDSLWAPLRRASGTAQEMSAADTNMRTTTEPENSSSPVPLTRSRAETDVASLGALANVDGEQKGGPAADRRAAEAVLAHHGSIDRRTLRNRPIHSASDVHTLSKHRRRRHQLLHPANDEPRKAVEDEECDAEEDAAALLAAVKDLGPMRRPIRQSKPAPLPLLRLPSRSRRQNKGSIDDSDEDVEDDDDDDDDANADADDKATYPLEPGDFVCIKMELCSGGTLLEYVEDGITLPLDIVVSAIYQIVRALAFVHSRRLIHFDIKLENVFVSTRKATGSGDPARDDGAVAAATFKIGDFGLATRVTRPLAPENANTAASKTGKAVTMPSPKRNHSNTFVNTAAASVTASPAQVAESTGEERKFTLSPMIAAMPMPAGQNANSVVKTNADSATDSGAGDKNEGDDSDHADADTDANDAPNMHGGGDDSDDTTPSARSRNRTRNTRNVATLTAVVGGTKPYQAPECFSLSWEELTPAVDMWALGCLLFEAVTCESVPEMPPYLGQTAAQGGAAWRAELKALSARFSVGLSASAEAYRRNPDTATEANARNIAAAERGLAKLFLDCLDSRPEERGTSEQVVNEPFFVPFRETPRWFVHSLRTRG